VLDYGPDDADRNFYSNEMADRRRRPTRMAW
jgi:hypothetical protein